MTFIRVTRIKWYLCAIYSPNALLFFCYTCLGGNSPFQIKCYVYTPFKSGKNIKFQSLHVENLNLNKQYLDLGINPIIKNTFIKYLFDVNNVTLLRVNFQIQKIIILKLLYLSIFPF